jgi:kynurenine formamidase
MRLPAWGVGLLVLAAFGLGYGLSGRAVSEAKEGKEKKTAKVKGWKNGKGWGPWGKDDEVGALNAMTPGTIKAALKLVKAGKVYDLGVGYDRQSFKWPGHSAAEIIMYRSPEGVKREGDFKPIVDPVVNKAKMGWHSCAVIINDNVGTQIDGLGHVTTGDDNHWYNGYTEAKWGGNFGVRKCDATTIPPIITRGVLIDVAGYRNKPALPSHYAITIDDLKGTLRQQKTKIRPGDTVLIRTGVLRYWGKNGADHDKLQQHDSAGITLKAAQWLVKDQGAILIGADTSGLEHWPDAKKAKKAPFIPVHRFLLIEQGVHIGEFHFLEDLAKDKVYQFCYVCMTNKIIGTTAGFTLRPIAIK